MAILDEIEGYFSDQSQWQRYGYAALRSGRQVDSQLIEEVAGICITEAAKRADSVPLSSGTVVSEVEDSTVLLLGIENVQNINCLAPDQKLSFAAQGLTVVYGDNGAGKTGYGRIVRQVCQARGAAPTLRANVFADVAAEGSAEIVYSLNGTEQRVTVSSGRSDSSPMRLFSIFDSAAANILVNEQNATAFRPFGLDLLDSFTSLADGVKRFIEDALSKQSLSFVVYSDFPETTKAGKILRGLSAAKGRENLDLKLVPLNDTEEARRKEVALLLAQAKSNDPVKLAQAINARATRYDQFIARLNRIATYFSSATLARFSELRAETIGTESAAEIARTKAFTDEPLKEIGGAVWRQLWEAARTYSTVAESGHTIVEATKDDFCVLCAQPLSASAAKRLQTLEEFVKGELQAKADKLRKKLDTALAEYNGLPLQFQGDDLIIEELAAENVEAAGEVKDFLLLSREMLALVQKHYSDGQGKLEPQKDPVVSTTLLELPASLRLRASELETAGTAQAILNFQTESTEFECLKKLADIAAQVRKESERLERREILERAKKFTTRGVTELSKRLTTQYVSDALCLRFSEEVKRFGLGHLNVRLIPSDSSKGKLFHRLVLNTAKDAPLKEIVSEGEFRCLALAAFLSESGTNKSGLLFDDPVSSLDHTWRERIARRLAEEAKTRQIVVFTHDIVFHFLIREIAEEAATNVQLTERCVERRGVAGSGFCREDAPWAGMKTKSRIGVLRNDLVGLKKEHTQGSADFEMHMRDWYGRLRESWERAIEECLLNDSVRRFQHSIQTNRLEKAIQKIQPSDWASIQKGMTRASVGIRGHDGARELNRPIPTPDEAAQDLEEFSTWVKTKA